MMIPVEGAELYCSTRGAGPACLVLCSIGTKPYERMMPPQLSDRLKLVYVRFDAGPLFAESEFKPAFMQHLLGPLTSAWDVSVGSGSERVPILLALGRYDYTVPHVVWDGVAEAIPCLTRRLFDKSGHQPFFEEPERFAAAVTEWMART